MSGEADFSYCIKNPFYFWRDAMQQGTERYGIKNALSIPVPMVVGQYCVFRLNVTLVMYGYGTVPMQ
ncbi:hypothetical protein KUBF_00110 [Bacteroides finegoldii]|nr:hypothetical protein KUBF_00110 [Bacteroides finegoldii]